MNTPSLLLGKQNLGGRFAGGLLLVALLWSPSLLAQQPADRSVEKSARVVERGAHHAKWETVSEAADPLTGETVSITNSYVQLETGLHYQDERGEWLQSAEEIELLVGAAVARHGPHQVRWAANLNTYGAIEFWTPEGDALRSHVLGLAYFDPATGAHVMIGEVQDSIGAVAGNQVIYEDAFVGLSADLHYTYTKGGFVQDVIVREKLPDPALWGFDSATVQVQVLTEFVNLPPALAELARNASETMVATNLLTGSFESAYAEDQTLNFGSMTMTQGRAFGVADVTQDRAVPVRKTLQQFEGGRTLLLETLDYREMKAEMETLPELSKPTASVNRQPAEQQVARLRVAPPAPIRQWASQISSPEKPQEKIRLLASADIPTGQNGYVIDYNLSGSTNNLTLQGDTTYYISGEVIATGITTIEGGTVVKYTNSPSARLKLQGTIKCDTALYRPAIFTSKDDDTVGSSVAGSTGSPSGHYAAQALWIDNNNSDLKFIHIRYAKQGIYYDSDTGYPHNVSHLQVVKSQYGIVSLSPVFYVRNVLFNEVITNFHTTASGITGHIEHLTANVANRINGSGSLTLNITNSLLIQITNSSSYSGSGNATASSASGVLQSVGGGNHYLINSSTNKNAGVTNISHALRQDFLRMTTQPPQVSIVQTLTSDTTLAPVVARDSDVPDRGYHYAALDYAVDTLSITNATLTLTNGVAIAVVGGYGIWLKDYADLISVGSPTSPNVLTDHPAVQEQPYTWNVGSYMYSIFPYRYGGSSASGTVDVKFTTFCSNRSQTLVYCHGGGNWYIQQALFEHCEFYRGSFDTQGTASDPINFTFNNNLFHRVVIWSWLDPKITFKQNTFRGADVDLAGFGSGIPFLAFTNNLFDKVTGYIYTNNLTASHNGFTVGSYFPELAHASNKTNLVADYQSGALGNFYLPASGSGLATLINAGSTNAHLLGLYHFTTQVSQAKETNSMVDIGYHYAAVNPAKVDLAKSGMTAYGHDVGFGWLAAYAINDVLTDNGWHNSHWTNVVSFLRIDLGSSKAVSQAGYIPRQYADNGSFKEYKIYVTDSTSTDPANWGNPVYHGFYLWPNSQERRDMTFNPKSGRYVVYSRITAYGYTTGSNPGYACANEIWVCEYKGLLSSALDYDGDGSPDYFEDRNGNGTTDGGESNWQSYNSPNGLTGTTGLQIYTPLKQ